MAWLIDDHFDLSHRHLFVLIWMIHRRISRSIWAKIIYAFITGDCSSKNRLEFRYDQERTCVEMRNSGESIFDCCQLCSMGFIPEDSTNALKMFRSSVPLSFRTVLALHNDKISPSCDLQFIDGFSFSTNIFCKFHTPTVSQAVQGSVSSRLACPTNFPTQ